MIVHPPAPELRKAIEGWGRGDVSDAELLRAYQHYAPNEMRTPARQRPRKQRRGRPEENGTFAKINSRVYADREIKAAIPLCSLLCSLAAGRGWCPARVGWLAWRLDVTPRTIQRWTKSLVDAEMIAPPSYGIGRGHRNRYTLLPAALPQPGPPGGRTRAQRRGYMRDAIAVAGKIKGDKIVALTPSLTATPPLTPPRKRGGDADGAPGRRAELLGARDGRSAARATPTVPTADASRAPPLAPAEFAGSTLARQGASAIRVRAPP